MSADVINACFNVGGSLAIWSSIFKLYKDKLVRGIHWPMMIFFLSWSTWNIWFYAHFQQWVSVAAGFLMFTSEAVYISSIFYYIGKEIKR